VPGIGKSRLVSALFRAVDEQSELIRWRQGRCIPYGERRCGEPNTEAEEFHRAAGAARFLGPARDRFALP
jgi:hypothetical protein